MNDESISVSCNFDSNTSEIQKIMSNCFSQQGKIFEIAPGSAYVWLPQRTPENALIEGRDPP